MTDDSISSSSWCYTNGIGYYSMKAILHSLLDRVSKNGTMLLNIAPMADGTIPAGQRSILLGIGDYLKRFGESVYATRAWAVYGEGPTKMGGGSFTTPVEGTRTDVRFTRSKDNTVLYATVLGWPGSTFPITTLGSSRINLGNLVSAQLLGPDAGTATTLPLPVQDASALRVQLPSANPPFDAPAYVVKLTFSGQVPTPGSGPLPTGWSRIANVTTGLVLDGGGSVAAGSPLKQWNWDGSNNLQWQLTDAGGGYVRIVNRTNGLVADSRGNTANGAICAADGVDRRQQPAVAAGRRRQRPLPDRQPGHRHGARRHGQHRRRLERGSVGAQLQHEQPVDHHRRVTAAGEETACVHDSGGSPQPRRSWPASCCQVPPPPNPTAGSR